MRDMSVKTFFGCFQSIKYTESAGFMRVGRRIFGINQLRKHREENVLNIYEYSNIFIEND